MIFTEFSCTIITTIQCWNISFRQQRCLHPVLIHPGSWSQVVLPPWSSIFLYRFPFFFLRNYMNWIVHHVVLCVWFLSQSRMYLSSSILFLPITFNCWTAFIDVLRFVHHPQVDGYLVWFQVWAVWTCFYEQLHTWHSVDRFSFLLGEYLGVNCCLMINLCVFFLVKKSVNCFPE